MKTTKELLDENNIFTESTNVLYSILGSEVILHYCKGSAHVNYSKGQLYCKKFEDGDFIIYMVRHDGEHIPLTNNIQYCPWCGYKL